jgi:hypothetical protein
MDFVSEPIEPAAGTSDTTAMSRGEPGLPGRFRWRDREHVVARVIAAWKSSTRDRGELYLRRHWFEVELSDGSRAKIYCERQTKNRSKPKARWWLYTLEPRA